MIYKGKDAECVWENDFQKFSCNRSPPVTQLFGINCSEIPMLIFHNELIPFAPFFNKHSILMDVYVAHLVINMECLGNKLWMNTASGVILSEPSGPSTSGPWSDVVRPIVVPTTVDMLKGDTCIRFFVSFGPSVDHTTLPPKTGKRPKDLIHTSIWLEILSDSDQSKEAREDQDYDYQKKGKPRAYGGKQL
uniref:Uncharacterized protein n=1 Tax=Moniliophthora roreri TaxID=221103 RepID=A0A0W0FTR9_MONRR